MLLERASGLIAAITNFEKIRSEADKAEQFHTRAEVFRRTATRIVRACNALRNFADAGIATNFVLNDTEDFASKANTLRTAISDDPTKIENPPFNLKYEFTDRLVGIADAAESAMAHSWNAHVKKYVSFESSEMLDALVEVPQFRTDVIKIRQCRTDIIALGNELPNNLQSALARLNILVADHEAAWKDLSAEDIPASVLKFIRACAIEGARLSTYTDEVRSWLVSRKLLDAFRIRLGGNS